MATTSATVFTSVMSALTGNTGGAVESLPPVTSAGAKRRVTIGKIAMAAQASGTVIGVARLPMSAVFLGARLATDVSLGTATVAFGDPNGATAFSPAVTITQTASAVELGSPDAIGVAISSGYDCSTGLANASYDDVVITTGVAALPASGTLTTIVEWALD